MLAETRKHSILVLFLESCPGIMEAVVVRNPFIADKSIAPTWLSETDLPLRVERDDGRLLELAAML